MTYKHKLARRLAISRPFRMVPVLLLLAACDDAVTGPDTGLPQPSEVTAVVPAAVTIQSNQRIRFHTETAGGKVVSTRLTWKSSGGSITADGVFSATAPGVYKVVGRGHGRHRPDTSTVTVVPPPSDVVGIQVSPGTASLETGASRTFTAMAHLADGSSAAAGVTWAATGGSIDAGGAYQAGATPGTFAVVATWVDGALADTAQVTITPPGITPTLAQVIIQPSSYTLATGGAKQFRPYGRNSLGDSVAVQATFSATGGTITSSGLYTAGATPGSYRVIALANGLADTAALTLSAPTSTTPSPSPTGAGLPFGMSQQLSRFGSPASPMTMTADGMTASTLIPRISAARAGGYKLIVNLTGGGHAAYMSTIDGVYQFDESKWMAQMETYNTATIRQAVAQAVADGTIVGSSVMDEPYVSGGANGGGNTWGPKGTMTKARVDTLCGVVKEMFPTLAAGVAHQHDQFEPTKSYRVCDFIIDQYDWRRGDVTAFRDAGLAMAQRDHHAVMFGINILDGGVQDKDGNYTCDGPGQGGKGTYAPNCRMTPQQVRDWGLLLGKAGCGLYMWRADNQFMANSANVQSLRDLASGLGTMPGKGCYRN
jgi:hypothetical protein